MSTKFRYHHLGIPTNEEFAGAMYLAPFRMWVSDHLATPYGIQWMKFADDCELPSLVKRVPHVAFEVDDLREAIRGKKVIIEPNEPAPGIMVAFIEEAGAPIEFLQIGKESQPNKLVQTTTTSVTPRAGARAPGRRTKGVGFALCRRSVSSAGFVLPKTDQSFCYEVRKTHMRTALILLLSCSLLRADAPSELKSALARLTGRAPVKAGVELQVSSGDDDAKKPAGPDSKAAAVVEDGPEGLRILWSRAVMDTADEEHRAQIRDPEAKTPTRRAMDGLSATRLSDYLDAAPELLRILDQAVFVEEKAETWEGQPARLLAFKLTPRLNERTRKMIKELDATVKIWIGADGLPLAAERRMYLKGRALLVISFDSTESESFRFKQTGDRLVVVRHVKESSGTGAGERNHQKTVANLTLAEG